MFWSGGVARSEFADPEFQIRRSNQEFRNLGFGFRIRIPGFGLPNPDSGSEGPESEVLCAWFVCLVCVTLSSPVLFRNQVRILTGGEKRKRKIFCCFF
jgi:hypothetical protein